MLRSIVMMMMAARVKVAFMKLLTTCATQVAPYGVAASQGYVFVANYTSNSVSMYSDTNGLLTLIIHYTVNVGVHPYGIATDAAGHVFVSSCSDYLIRSYTNTGTALNLIGSASTDTNPYIINASLPGYVMATNLTSSTITVYTNTAGVLVRVSTYTCPAGAAPLSIATDSAGHIFVCYPSLNQVASFSMSGGVLTLIGTYATGAYPYSVTVDANNHVFVANEGGSTLSSFSNANGVLTLIGTYATGTNPYAVTVNAAGLVLVANVTSNDVTVFSNANGVLTLIGTYATGITQPGAAVIDSTDHLILTSYNGNTVSSFS